MQNIAAKFNAKRQRMSKCIWKDKDTSCNGERYSVSEIYIVTLRTYNGKNMRKFIVIHRIQNLCFCWEKALSHGLKTTSIFQNIVSGNLTTETSAPSFWEFAHQHLTGHEKERFSTLRYGLY